MKKIMIGILVIIPIIIIATVGAVTRFVTANAWIGVESISFDFENDKKEIELTFGKEYYDLNDYISVTVLPERATDKSFVWSIGNGKDELKSTDPEYQERWDNEEVEAPAVMVDANGNVVDENDTGRIRVNSYCYFTLYVKAEQYQDKCTVFVGGGDVKAISIKGTNEMKTGETALFTTIFTPLDAIVDQVKWESDNENVATVDGNGLVNAVGAGTAIIKATAISRKDDEVPATASATFAVKVIKGVSYFGEIVNIEVSKNTISLKDLGIIASPENVYVGCTVDGDMLTINDDDATIATLEGTVRFRIVEDNGIEILGYDVYNFDDEKENPFILSVGKTISFNAVFKDRINHSTAIVQNVVWETSNPDVLSLKDGVFTGLKSGRAKVTAKYYDGDVLLSSTSLMLAVEEKVTMLILETTNSSLEVGLAKETVFASKKYTNVETGATTDNSFEIKFVRPTPTEDNAEVFYKGYNFVVKEVIDGEEFATDLAYFDDNVIYFDSEKIKGVVNFKVTVSAKYPLYSYMMQYTTQSFNLKVAEGIEVYDEPSLKKAAANTTGAVVLVDDIFVTNPRPGYDRSTSHVALYCDLYGNNKMIRSSVAEFNVRDDNLIHVECDDVLISNAILRVNEVEDEITNWGDEESQSLLGVGVCFQGTKSALNKFDETTGTYEDNRIKNCRIEYCIVENCRMGFNFISAVGEVEGCIVRNCLELGAWIPTRDNDGNNTLDFSDVTFKNNIFSNMCGVAIILPYENIGDNLEALDREDKHTKIKIEGFIDIYNWQELNCLNVLPKDGMGEEYADIVPIINSSLGGILEGLEGFDTYRYVENGVTYFNLGVLGTGAIETCNVKLECEDERINCIDTTTIDHALLSSLKRIYIWVYDNESDIVPSTNYRVNAKLIDHLHGKTA